MTRPARSIRAKVATGYILLIAILLFSVWYVYQEMEQLSAPDQYEAELNLKRKATNNLLAQLYQAEIISQSLSTGRLDDYPLYKKASTKARAATDSLKSLITDSLQLLRIDSIADLLVRKDRNIADLLRMIRNANGDKLYRKSLENIISQQDSLLTNRQVQRKEVVKKSSYTIKKKKKGFFKRLGELFVPGKNDSTVVTNTSREFVTDTLVQAFSPADTVVNILKDIQSKVSGERREAEEEYRNRSNAIRYNGLVVNHKINRIIQDFEEEETSRSLAKLEHEKTIRRKSVRTISWIAITAVLLSGGFLILIWQDITRSNRYRSQLEAARRKAEELLAAREKLMLTITHDIKAPAGSILGYADLLSRLTKEERQLFYLANMKSSSEHLLRLVNDLLDFHRLDSNKMEVNRIAFNPRQLLEEILTSFDPAARRKELQLDREIDPLLDGHFLSDPFRIRQIAGNLLSNALKFTQHGSVTFKAWYTGKYLRFTVKDTGCGIPAGEQEKIFREFTRLKNAQGEEGFGLGLSITRMLVSLLEGEISLTSNVGEGTEFTVLLPLQPATEPHSPDREPAPGLPLLPHGLNVLLIDDDRIQLDLTKAMLGQLHVAARCCQSPEELFVLLKEESFDLLFTDVQMPGLNGFELLTRLRDSEIPQAGTIPVIAVTARGDLDREYFLSKGFAGCLHKPFSLDELARAAALLPQINGKRLTDAPDELNLGALTAFSEDDPEAAAEILHTFAAESEKDCRKMEDALKSGNIRAIAATAHKILPLFTLIGASRCIEPLRWLEKQRDAETLTPVAEEKTQFLIGEIRRLTGEMLGE